MLPQLCRFSAVLPMAISHDNRSTARYLTLPEAIVLSVVVRHGNVPTGSS